MMDTGDIKGASHAAGAQWGNPAMGRTKGRDTKIHVAVDAQGLSVTVAMTEGRAADCEAACPLMEGYGRKVPVGWWGL